MNQREKDRIRDRRNIGRVVSPIEQLVMARARSSCCAGQEALLASGWRPERDAEDGEWHPTVSA